GAGGLPFGAAVAGAPGTSAGGAIFVNAGATATAVVTPPVFAGNVAAADNDVAGLLALPPPVIAAVATVPTLGEWALLVLVLLVATFGMRARRDH
ncbi:MAG: IPTL-CTERM sorting domain-containing protein, partial [Haliea sp.]